MNQELEKFLEEIKILIEDYETYAIQTLPDYSSIIRNTDREYTNDEEGKILQDLDEQLANLVNLKMETLKQVREKNTQEKQEAIYSKVKEFLETNKQKINAQVGEIESEIVKLIEENDKSISRMNDIKSNFDKYTQAGDLLKNVDKKIYTAINEAQVRNINEHKEESKRQARITELSKKANNKIRQLKRMKTELEKVYGAIDFESEKGIEELKAIITSRALEQEQGTEKNGIKFPRLSPDEIEVEEPEKILITEEAKIKAEEEQMWEEYRKEQEKAQKEKYEKMEEQRKEQIRKDKEELFKSKEEGYQDLLETDTDYQALKESLINRYSLEQLEKALKGKSLIDIYSLYVKQVNKNLDNSTTIKENLTEKEMNEKVAETLENEELKRKLSLRLENLKQREKYLEELRELQKQQKPLEKIESYKETKIIIEPYKDTITVYLKGHDVPFVCNNIAERIIDGENFIKSGRMSSGLIKGIKNGDAAIISVLQEIEDISGYDKLIDGYTWMFTKFNIGKRKHPSQINEILYDFTDESGIKDNNPMIEQMKKYAGNAVKYGVAQSTEPIKSKNIFEKIKDSIVGLGGKGKEKILTLGEGIKNIESPKEKISRAKKRHENKQERKQKAKNAYQDWKEMLRDGSPTQDAQANLAQIFMDKSAQETQSEKDYNREQDEFYDSFGN